MAFPSLPLSILLGVIGPWQIVLEFKNAKDGIEEGNKDKP